MTVQGALLDGLIVSKCGGCSSWKVHRGRQLRWNKLSSWHVYIGVHGQQGTEDDWGEGTKLAHGGVEGDLSQGMLCSQLQLYITLSLCSPMHLPGCFSLVVLAVLLLGHTRMHTLFDPINLVIQKKCKGTGWGSRHVPHTLSVV